jgi:hypothetical protein
MESARGARVNLQGHLQRHRHLKSRFSLMVEFSPRRLSMQRHERVVCEALKNS